MGEASTPETTVSSWRRQADEGGGEGGRLALASGTTRVSQAKADLDFLPQPTGKLWTCTSASLPLILALQSLFATPPYRPAYRLHILIVCELILALPHSWQTMNLEVRVQEAGARRTEKLALLPSVF